MAASFNIFIIACIIAACIWGIWKGFTTQLVSIVALVLGIWLSAKLTKPFAGLIADLMGTSVSTGVMRVVSFIILFVLILIICRLIEKGLKGSIRISMLSWVDKFLGALFCILKVMLVLAIIACIVNYICTTLGISTTERLEKSRGFAVLMNFADIVLPFIKSLFS